MMSWQKTSGATRPKYGRAFSILDTHPYHVIHYPQANENDYHS